MKRFLIFLLFVSTLVAQPTTITVVSRTNIAPGTALCIPVGPCDNTVAHPAAAVGVVTASVANGRNFMLTVQVNSVYPAPVPFGTACSVGDYVGDVNGTGVLGDLGAPNTAPGPFSYVGVCQGVSADLTKLFVIVQPGYVIATATPKGQHDQ